MTRFICNDLKNISSYTPGEQPTGRSFIKLNTNESPYAPPKAVIKAASGEAAALQLYSDPDARELTGELAEFHSLSEKNILTTNGSDEGLAFIVQAYARGKRVVFPDITYGFYASLCTLYNVPFLLSPLLSDFKVNLGDFKKADVIFLANPNAPTGISLDESELLDFIKLNKNKLIIVDEAYVDFGGKSVAAHVNECANLIVTRTFSKSRSLAGARLGYIVANAEIIKELTSIKFSFNPYSVNRMTLAAGTAAMRSNIYYNECLAKIVRTRDEFSAALRGIGFEVLSSSANFVLAKSDFIGGAELKERLMDEGILVRHFNQERISDYVRITIGTDKDMQTVINKILKIRSGL